MTPSPATAEHAGDDEPLPPVAFRFLDGEMPNEALREDLAAMTPEEERAYLERLEELARQYQGPGGP
jgi:hypothetical protein